MDIQIPKDTAIKLRIDKLNPRQFKLFSTVILLALGAVFLFASYAPSAFLKQNRPHADCIQSVYNELGYGNCVPFSLADNPVFTILADDIDSSNKFITLELTPLKTKSKEHAKLAGPVEVSAFTIQGNEIQSTLYTKEKRDLSFTCSDSQSEPCNYEQVLSLPTLEDKDYYFVIRFLDSQDLKTLASDFQVVSSTLNLGFRNYLFAVKFLFVAVAFLTLIYQFTKLRGLRTDFFSREQKFLKFVAPMLLTIDEPFTRHICEGTFYYWFTTANFVAFSALVMWFWMTMIHDIGGSESSVIEKSSKFVKLYTVAYFFVNLVTYVSLANFALTDPSFGFGSEENGFFVFLRYLLYLTLLVGAGWIGYKTNKIIRRMNDLTDRESTFFWFSAFFIVCHFYLVLRGTLYPFTYDSAGLILFAGISTIYILSSNYLYLPTQEGIEQANHLKKYDNPDAKASYKDLEDSVVHPPKQIVRNDEHMITAAKTGGSYNNMVTAEKENVEQKYPFEHGGDEEL